MDLINANLDQMYSEEDSFTLERYEQFINLIELEDAKILDCGCNTGRGGSLIKQRRSKWKIWGSELVEERIKIVPPNIYEEIFIGSSDKLNVSDKYFDVIVSGEVVEHIPVNIFSAVLLEFNRVLKKDGKIILTTPNPDSYLVKLGRNRVFNELSHVNVMSINVLSNYIIDAGFTVENILGSGKAIRLFGEKFPLINVYGSYLITARKVN